MSVSTVGERRIELSSTTALLAVGDVLAIALFVTAGEFTHGINPFLNPGRAAGTLAPFLVGWVLVAGLGGLYARDSISSITGALGRTFLAWTLAVGVAQALRATAVFHGNAALTFALVSIGVGGVLLCGWRGMAALLLGR
jgi:FtsH-binding integral membrane protein